MIWQDLERFLVHTLHDAGTRCLSVWPSNELSQLAPGKLEQTSGRWTAVNLPHALSRVPAWPRAARDFRLARRRITGRVQRPRPVDEDRVRPRHYPPRSCPYLDDSLMNREMYDHVRGRHIRSASRPAFRLRHS